MTTTLLQRDSLLRQAVELGASDLIAGHPVMIMVAGARRA